MGRSLYKWIICLILILMSDSELTLRGLGAASVDDDGNVLFAPK